MRDLQPSDHLCTFTAVINNIPCRGKIDYNIHYWLCQNVADGDSAPNKLGYNYSWSVGLGSVYYLNRNDVEELIIFPEDKDGFDNMSFISNGEESLYVISSNEENVLCSASFPIKEEDKLTLISRQELLDKSFKGDKKKNTEMLGELYEEAELSAEREEEEIVEEDNIEQFP